MPSLPVPNQARKPKESNPWVEPRLQQVLHVIGGKLLAAYNSAKRKRLDASPRNSAAKKLAAPEQQHVYSGLEVVADVEAINQKCREIKNKQFAVFRQNIEEVSSLSKLKRKAAETQKGRTSSSSSHCRRISPASFPPPRS
jgi:hypothetical protein